jgi:hypothetical protein
VAGVGDLLALFRCVSCRYRFSADASRPALMGAIGRVYASCEVRVLWFCCAQSVPAVAGRRNKPFITFPRPPNTTKQHTNQP